MGVRGWGRRMGGWGDGEVGGRRMGGWLSVEAIAFCQYDPTLN
uniref:Uncharacterized protein n=1 Tax=Desertifilum tharense IPPAS B-1220 TaxID=1781255 RepID=A0ACD5GUR4_9CYAN